MSFCIRLSNLNKYKSLPEYTKEAAAKRHFCTSAIRDLTPSKWQLFCHLQLHFLYLYYFSFVYSRYRRKCRKRLPMQVEKRLRRRG